MVLDRSIRKSSHLPPLHLDLTSPYPFPLTSSPPPSLPPSKQKVGAIAAGNAVCLKPSELASSTERLLAELIPQYLDPALYKVVTAEIPGTTKLLELQWDHSASFSPLFLSSSDKSFRRY